MRFGKVLGLPHAERSSLALIQIGAGERRALTFVTRARYLDFAVEIDALVLGDDRNSQHFSW